MPIRAFSDGLVPPCEFEESGGFVEFDSIEMSVPGRNP